MGLFSRNKEKLQDPAVQEKQDREAVLNDAKFMESLDSNPNVDIDSNTEVLKQAHEAFKTKESTSRDLQELFKNEISRDLGLNFDAAENKDIAEKINEFLNAEMIDNPERIIKLKEEIVKFTEYQKKIEEQKKILSNLGESVDNLWEKQGAIYDVLSSKKFIQGIRSYSQDYQKSRDTAQAGYGIDLKNIKEEQAKLKEKLKTGVSAKDELQSLQDNFKNLRKSILQDLAPMAALQELAQQKVKTKLEKMTDSTKPENLSVKNLEQAKQLFDKLAVDNFQMESGLDYTDPSFNTADFYDSLNEQLESAFLSDAEEAVDKVKGSSLTLKRMSEVLKPLFEKSALGDKKAAEVKQFLVSYLKDDLLPTLNKSQQILLNAAIESYA
jgi:hypothetical protein